MRTLNDYFITVRLADVSATGGVAFVAIPDGGRVIKIHTVQEGAITGADAVITFFTKQGGATVMTSSGITVLYHPVSPRSFSSLSLKVNISSTMS